MYRQSDGYPRGHGKELAEFLKDFRIVNGRSLPKKKDRLAYGISCLAAQVIAHFKSKAGEIYLFNGNERDCWEEYIYIVENQEKSSKPKLSIIDCRKGRIIFEGTPENFLESDLVK